MQTADFTELLRISSFLDGLGENEIARAAFERGYQDFWQRGNDPRIFVTLFGRLVLIGRIPFEQSKSMSKHRDELIERLYKLQPYGQSADLAWELYADYLSKAGRSEDARVWRARAEDAKKNALLPFRRSRMPVSTDGALLAIFSSILAAFVYFLALYARYRSQRRLDLAASKQGRFSWRFAFFNTEYWSRRERIAFLIVVCTGWLAAGVAGQFVQRIIRVASSPISLGMGSFGGPVNTWYLENRQPPTDERNLWLAVAYQQGGENEKAERLYRSLPQFAESWNNLGVILKNSGHDPEARQAFEQALRINPDLAEAALNLGRPAQTYWTEQHQKYLPNAPMIAPPQRERMRATLGALGASPAKMYFRALAGPFAGVPVSMLKNLAGLSLPWPGILLASALLAFALAVLFLFPSREVTQPPGKMQPIWEMLFPGTTPSWRIFGGLVLVAWSYFLLQDVLLFSKGSPYIIIRIAIPNVVTLYGVPATSEDVLRLINPSWVGLYAAPAVLFTVNLVLVFRDRLFHKRA